MGNLHIRGKFTRWCGIRKWRYLAGCYEGQLCSRIASFGESRPHQLSLNQPAGESGVTSYYSLLPSYNTTIHERSALENQSTLVNALSWEARRGHRCDFWRSSADCAEVANAEEDVKETLPEPGVVAPGQMKLTLVCHCLRCYHTIRRHQGP